jgi:peptidoglycan/xylan/chitin deacetylase (PgdA/CDA1 family)
MLAGAGAASAAEGEQRPLLERCWTANALTAQSGEEATRRRRITLDLTALRRRILPSMTPVPSGLRGSIRRVDLPPGRKLVALTFDLCETPFSIAGYDGPIVDYLRAHDMRATFFASGKWFETHTERAQQLIADPRFEVGNHGFEHRDFRRLGGAGLSDEIVLAQAAYARARAKLAVRACLPDGLPSTDSLPPEQMTLLRFPYGTCNAKALDAVAQNGLLAIQWDVVSGDPDPGRSARAIAAGILKAVKPGSIVIAHANGRGRNTAGALPLVIPKLRAKGYEFVTVSELLAAGTPVIARSCYERRRGDNVHIGAVARSRKKGKGTTDNDLRALLQFPD